MERNLIKVSVCVCTCLCPCVFVFIPVCDLQMLGALKQLSYLDVSKNNLEMVDEQICGCESLQDLLLSNNALTQLPGSIGEWLHTQTVYTHRPTDRPA